MGTVSNTKMMHITKNAVPDNELITLTPSNNSTFHTSMEFFKVVENYELTYVATYTGWSSEVLSHEYSASTTLDDITDDENDTIYLLVTISGTTYVHIPDSLLRPADFQLAYMFRGSTAFLFTLDVPDSVRLVRVRKYIPNAANLDILISGSHFRIGGTDFGDELLSISDSVITYSDDYYSTPDGILTILNSAADNSGWFLTNTSFGRVTTGGQLNYFVKGDTANYTRHKLLGFGYNQIVLDSADYPVIQLTTLAVGLDATSSTDTSIDGHWSVSTVYLRQSDKDIYFPPTLNAYKVLYPLGYRYLAPLVKYSSNIIQAYVATFFKPSDYDPSEPIEEDTADRVYFIAHAVL
jgi:hypothetical protein